MYVYEKDIGQAKENLRKETSRPTLHHDPNAFQIYRMQVLI